MGQEAIRNQYKGHIAYHRPCPKDILHQWLGHRCWRSDEGFSDEGATVEVEVMEVVPVVPAMFSEFSPNQRAALTARQASARRRLFRLLIM